MLNWKNWKKELKILSKSDDVQKFDVSEFYCEKKIAHPKVFSKKKFIDQRHLSC